MRTRNKHQISCACLLFCAGTLFGSMLHMIGGSTTTHANIEECLPDIDPSSQRIDIGIPIDEWTSDEVRTAPYETPIPHATLQEEVIRL